MIFFAIFKAFFKKIMIFNDFSTWPLQRHSSQDATLNDPLYGS